MEIKQFHGQQNTGSLKKIQITFSMKSNPLVRLRKLVRLIIVMNSNSLHGDFDSKAKIALLTSNTERTEVQQEVICIYMLRLAFFQRLRQDEGQQTVLEVCKHLQYQRHHNGKEVIRINSIGARFYVILSGVVGVYLYRPLNESAAAKLKKASSYLDYDDVTQFLKERVAILSAGHSFGEYSLLNTSNYTNATISTLSTCEFSYLERNKYRSILGRKKQVSIQKLKKRMTQKRNLNSYSSLTCSVNGLEQIVALSHTSSLKRPVGKDQLYSKRALQIIKYINTLQLYQFFYFILKGSFRIEKQIKNQMEDDIIYLKKNVPSKYVTISILKIGEMFGQDKFLGHSSNQFNIIVQELEASVYKIEHQNLLGRLWDNEMVKNFYNSCEFQFNWRFTRFEAIKKEMHDYTEQQNQKQIFGMQRLLRAAQPNLIKVQHRDTVSKSQRSKQRLDLFQLFQNRNAQHQILSTSVEQNKREYQNSKLTTSVDENNRSPQHTIQSTSVQKKREYQQSNLCTQVDQNNNLQSNSPRYSLNKTKLELSHFVKQQSNRVILNRGKVQRFITHNEDVEDNYQFNSRDRVDVVPRISMRPRKIVIDCLKAEEGIETLLLYDMNKKNNSAQQISQETTPRKIQQRSFY